MDHYYQLKEYPSPVSANTVFVRLLDGLGFRFRWATHELTEENYTFRPSPDCMSIEELVGHVWGLVNWVSIEAWGEKNTRPEGPEEIRKAALDIIWDLRTKVDSLGEGELEKLTIRDLPFWHIINGPVSDALTHTGQINSFRRLAGNPTPGANVFTGTPPES